MIISGGTVNTPQILELSGIGAKAVLDKAGVRQVVDLPSVVRPYSHPAVLPACSRGIPRVRTFKTTP